AGGLRGGEGQGGRDRGPDGPRRRDDEGPLRRGGDRPRGDHDRPYPGDPHQGDPRRDRGGGAPDVPDELRVATARRRCLRCLTQTFTIRVAPAPLVPRYASKPE